MDNNSSYVLQERIDLSNSFRIIDIARTFARLRPGNHPDGPVQYKYLRHLTVSFDHLVRPSLETRPDWPVNCLIDMIFDEIQ